MILWNNMRLRELAVSLSRWIVDKWFRQVSYINMNKTRMSSLITSIIDNYLLSRNQLVFPEAQTKNKNNISVSKP